jgi:hypothetical protein
MKHSCLRFAATLVNLTFLSAQNYQTFYSDRIAYFENEDGYIKCIRIDSVIANGDSVFYPFHNIQPVDYDCYTPFGDSWIGEKVVIDTNGFNYFFNKDHDTIKIKTNALLYEEWVAFQIPDSLIIIARISYVDTDHFIYQADSVKTVRFQVYDELMHPISCELNSMMLKLSQNFGIIKTFNFYLFPDFMIDYPLYDHFEELELVGLSKPQIGLNNLTTYKIYDFQPGDELHILYDSYSSDEFNYSANTYKSIYKYISRSDYPDSTAYQRVRTRSEHRVRDENSTFEYFHDTIIVVIKADSLFDKLPGEQLVTDNEAWTYKILTGEFAYKIQPSHSNTIYYDGESCWNYIPIDDCDPEYRFIEGLGGPYYQCEFPFWFGAIKNLLVYYKKGDVTWGTPLVVSGIESPEAVKNFEVYPNPASGVLYLKTVSASLPVRFVLFDLQGCIVFIKESITDAGPITLDDHIKGLYFYKISNNDFTETGKIVIE